MLYFDTAPAFERLDDADAGKLIKALLSYSATGELLPLEGMASLAFDLIRPKLDRDAAKYEEKVTKRRYAGYSKASRDKGEEPLDFANWLERQDEQVQANASMCMPTAKSTTASTPITNSNAAATTITDTEAASTSKDNVSWKGMQGENPMTPEEFEKSRREKMEQLRNYGNGVIR